MCMCVCAQAGIICIALQGLVFLYEQTRNEECLHLAPLLLSEVCVCVCGVLVCVLVCVCFLFVSGGGSAIMVLSPLARKVYGP